MLLGEYLFGGIICFLFQKGFFRSGTIPDWDFFCRVIFKGDTFSLGSVFAVLRECPYFTSYYHRIFTF